MSEYIIDKVSTISSKEIDDIARIELECFRLPWTSVMIAESLSHHCNYWLAKAGDSGVGYIGLYDTGDITNIAVSSDYRGQGIASKLLHTAIAYAKGMGIESIFLEVRASNISAIALYEKNSFKQINKRNKYYEDGEDALIYCLEVMSY